MQKIGLESNTQVLWREKGAKQGDEAPVFLRTEYTGSTQSAFRLIFSLDNNKQKEYRE